MRRLFLTLMIIIGILASAFFGVYQTEIGLKWVFACIPGLSYHTLSGSLSQGIHLSGLHYQSGNNTLTADQVDLQLQPFALLHKTIAIQSLHTQNVQIHHQTATASANNPENVAIPFAIPALKLPVNVTLNDIDLQQTHIHLNTQTVILPSVQLKASAKQQIIHIDHADIQLANSKLSVSGKIPLEQLTQTQLTALLTTTGATKTQIDVKLAQKQLQIISKGYWYGAAQLDWQKATTGHWTFHTTQVPTKNNTHFFIEAEGGIHSEQQHAMLSTNMTIKNLRIASHVFDLAIQSHSQAFQHQIQLTLGMDHSTDIQLKSHGQYQNKQWQAEVFKLHVQRKHASLLTLTQPMHITIPLETTSLPKHITVSAPALMLDRLNVALQDINSTIDIGTRGQLSIIGHAISNQHPIQFTGSGTTGSTPSVSFTLSGQSLLLCNTPELTILASPDVKVNYHQNLISVRGTIDFPKLIMKPKDFSTVETLPKQVVFVDNTAVSTTNDRPLLKWALQLALSSEHIHVFYRGLNADLAGKLQLIESANTPFSASGKLSIKQGQYKAYGQQLVIQPGGSLTFLNNIKNPSLNLKASKTIDPDSLPLGYQQGLTVGTQVTGTLSNPDITLYAIPATLGQQDILSYLVFGFPQSQLNSSQSALIWQAINSVNTGERSLGDLQSTLRKTLGLTQLGFTTTSEYNPETETEESGAGFIVGKRINQRLSVSYNIGLLVPINILFVRYDLSQQWALQTDSSTYGDGVDVLYHFSRE